MIEDALIEKMSKWHYDPNHFKSIVSEDLFKVLNMKWNNTASLEKDIREQTLREVLSSASNKEVKELMKKYENRHTPRFRICQILGNNIESLVKAMKQLWEVLLKDRVEEDKKKEAIEIKDDDGLPKIASISESSVEEVVATIMTTLPLSPIKALSPPSSKGEESIAQSSVLVTPSLAIPPSASDAPSTSVPPSATVAQATEQ